MARDTTKSYCIRWSGSWWSASARACMGTTQARSNSRAKCSHALIFFPTESSSVKTTPGLIIERGIPGNPPPVPISMLLPSSFSKLVIMHESTKCLRMTHSASRMAERFVCPLYSKKSSRNFSKTPSCLGESSMLCCLNNSFTAYIERSVTFTVLPVCPSSITFFPDAKSLVTLFSSTR